MKQYFFIGCLVLSSLGFAQDKTWKLTECLDYALKNNLTIQRNLLQVNVTDWEKKAAFASFLPTLNASASGNMNFGRSIDPYTNQFVNTNTQSTNFGISSGVTLFNAGNLRLKYSNASLKVEEQKYNTKQIERDVSLNLALAYLQVLFQKDNLANAERKRELSKQLVDNTKIRVQNGADPQSKLLELESQFQTEEQNLLNAEYNLENARLNLFQLMDIRDYQNQKVESPTNLTINQTLEQFDVDAIFEKAKFLLPQYRAQELQKEQAENNMKIAKSSGLPTLRLSGQFGSLASDQAKDRIADGLVQAIAGIDADGNPVLAQTNDGKPIYQPNFALVNKPFSDQIKDNLNTNVAVALNIPIFNGLQSKTSIERAKVQVLTSDITLRETENKLYKDVQNAVIDAKKAQKAYLVAKRALVSAQENFDNAKVRYELSALSVYDYQQVRNTLFVAKTQLAQAKYDFIFKRMIIRFYQGEEIRF
jgi:outer membrane protein